MAPWGNSIEDKVSEFELGRLPPKVAVILTVPPEYPKSPIHQIPPLAVCVQTSLLVPDCDAQWCSLRVGLAPARRKRSMSPVPEVVTVNLVGLADVEIE